VRGTFEEVIDQLVSAGFDGSLELAQDQVSLCCTDCGANGLAEQFDLRGLQRVEGDDEQSTEDDHVVLTVVCFNCGGHGTLVLLEGPHATAIEAEVLAVTRRARAQADEERGGTASS